MTRKGLSLKPRTEIRAALELIKQKYGSPPTQVVEALVERWCLENDPQIALEAGIRVRPANPFVGGVPAGGPPQPTFGNDGRPELTPADRINYGAANFQIEPSLIGGPATVPPLDFDIPPSQRGRE